MFDRPSRNAAPASSRRRRALRSWSTLERREYAAKRRLVGGKRAKAIQYHRVRPAGIAAAVAPAQADQYPDKPIRVISDSAPGSALDVTFRIVMDRLGKVLGPQIVCLLVT